MAMDHVKPPTQASELARHNIDEPLRVRVRTSVDPEGGLQLQNKMRILFSFLRPHTPDIIPSTSVSGSGFVSPSSPGWVLSECWWNDFGRSACPRAWNNFWACYPGIHLATLSNKSGDGRIVVASRRSWFLRSCVSRVLKCVYDE